MTHPVNRRRWLSLPLAALAAALLVPVALAQEASQPVLPGEPNPPWDDGALPAVVDPTLVDPQLRTWSHVGP
jgi:hypothetical protein